MSSVNPVMTSRGTSPCNSTVSGPIFAVDGDMHVLFRVPSHVMQYKTGSVETCELVLHIENFYISLIRTNDPCDLNGPTFRFIGRVEAEISESNTNTRYC